MYANSHKRINSSKLLRNLSDLTHTEEPKNFLQRHFSTSGLNNAASADDQWSHRSCIFTSMFTFFPAATCQFYCTNAACVSPSSSLRHICSLHKRLSDYIYPAVSSMETRLIGWFSLECIMGRTCLHRRTFTYATLQRKWIFLTHTLILGWKQVMWSRKWNPKAMVSLKLHQQNSKIWTSEQRKQTSSCGKTVQYVILSYWSSSGIKIKK